MAASPSPSVDPAERTCCTASARSLPHSSMRSVFQGSRVTWRVGANPWPPNCGYMCHPFSSIREATAKMSTDAPSTASLPMAKTLTSGAPTIVNPSMDATISMDRAVAVLRAPATSR